MYLSSMLATKMLLFLTTLKLHCNYNILYLIDTCIFKAVFKLSKCLFYNDGQSNSILGMLSVLYFSSDFDVQISLQ